MEDCKRIIIHANRYFDALLFHVLLLGMPRSVEHCKAFVNKKFQIFWILVWLSPRADDNVVADLLQQKQHLKPAMLIVTDCLVEVNSYNLRVFHLKLLSYPRI